MAIRLIGIGISNLSEPGLQLIHDEWHRTVTGEIKPLLRIDVNPSDIRIPAAPYNDLLYQGEDIAEEKNPTGSEDED